MCFGKAEQDPQSETMTNSPRSETELPHVSRRSVIRTIGAGSVAGLAGCAAQTGSDDGTPDSDESTPGSNDDTGGGDNTIVDMIGREIEVPGTVEQVIGLGPTGLRQVCQMGAADMVVGVEENEHGWSREIPYNMANPHFQDLPVIGPQFGGEPELIAREDPDVIFYRGRGGDPAGANELQQKTGIPVIFVTQDDMGPNRDVLYDSWKVIGQVLNKKDRAASLIDFVETTITDLDDRTKDVPDDGKPTSYAGGVSHHGPQGLNSTKAPFPPLGWVNAKFAAEELNYGESDRDRLKVQVSKEKLLEWDPEVIFVDLGNLETVKEGVQKNQEFQQLSAIQNDRVYGYHPYHQYNFNATTTLANSYFMGATLYPDQFNDISSGGKADEIYQKFFGSPVYDQMAETFGGYGKVDLTR